MTFCSICIDNLPSMNEICTAKVPYHDVVAYAAFSEKMLGGTVIYSVECDDGIVYVVRLPKGKWEKK